MSDPFNDPLEISAMNKAQHIEKHPMSGGDDGEQTIDIHDYTQQRLQEEGVNSRTNPHEARELITRASATYLIQADADDIDDYEYHYISLIRLDDLMSSAQAKFHEEVERYFEEVGEVSDMSDEELLELSESAGRFTIGNNVTLSYSIAYELVEDFMRKLIPDILRDDVDESAGQVLESQLGSYSGKADVLKACRIIDKDTRESIRHIKRIRDQLVHNVEERYSLSLLEDLNEMDQIQGAVNTLYEAVYDMPGYRYVDEE
jgi:uncharacterized protein YutE (UPF0331/DUF86 family)